MAPASDEVSPYESGGAGGKFRKRPNRRSVPATPYDRPPTALRNNSQGFFARLIYAGADRLFGVFRKRLPSTHAQRLSETNEESTNAYQEAGPNNCAGVSGHSTDKGGNSASMFASTETSELENMLKQKTFTRSEIEHLTALMRSRTTESDVNEGDIPKLPILTSLRLEASTSGPLKHVEERENLHINISTPAVNLRAFEEDVATPAELAKAYMGTRPSKVLPLSSTIILGSQAPIPDSGLHNNTAILPRMPITSLAPRTASSFKGFENGLTTPRSRGRSAIYSMARTPYYRGLSTLSQKGIKSDYGHGVASPSLTLSTSAWKHEGSIESSKMGLKRRSSVLDDIGSGGRVRRIRQKANLLMQGSSLSKHGNEFDSSAHRHPGAASKKLLLRNEPEPKASKAVDENGVTSRHNLGGTSVPTKSMQMASKIFEQLERLSPKEKPSRSRLAGMSEKSPIKCTSDMIHGRALESPEKVDSPKLLLGSQENKKSEGQHHEWLSDVRESTSQNKDKVEENGPRKFAVPRNVLTSVNRNLTSPVRDSATVVANSNSTLKLSAEPPQKKRAFQMRANEESVELDDHNHIQLNGHASTPSDENKKPGTFMIENKGVSAHESAEVNKIPEMPKFKKLDDGISPPKTNGSAGIPFNGSSSLFDSIKKKDQVQLASNKDDKKKDEKSISMVEKSESLSSANPTTPSASGIFSFGGLTKNSNTTNSLLNTTASFATMNTKGGMMAFSSPAATSTTNDHPQGSFNAASGFSSTPTFGFSSTSATPSSSSSSTATIFSSAFSSTPTFGLSASVASSEAKSGNVFGSQSTVFSFGASSSSSMPSTSSSPFAFGSSNPEASTGSSSMFSFTATKSSFPPSSSTDESVFGSSMPVFASTTVSPNNNDQMSMDDSMVKDSTQTLPNSSIFGSTTPPPPTVPFEFGDQMNQPPSQNPFQASGNGQTTQPPSQNPFQASGGSFSLGSDGGDKSGRRIVRVKKNRKK